MSRNFKILMMIGLVSIMTLNSCKDPVPPKATVTVRNGMDNNGLVMNKLLEGAIVTVYIDPNSGKPGYVDPAGKVDKQVKTTDASGTCTFDFSLENILQVKAEYPFSGDTLYGEGVLVLEEDKTYEETIHLRKYKSQL